LIQLVEADPSQEETILPAMYRFVDLMHSMLANNYTGYIPQPGDVFDASWGQARDHDMMISLQWLYENYPANYSQTLLDNMNYLNDKAYDWAYWWQDGVFFKGNLDTTSPDYYNAVYPYLHGVNVGQGMS
jgi:hypothetical protein